MNVIPALYVIDNTLNNTIETTLRREEKKIKYMNILCL